MKWLLPAALGLALLSGCETTGGGPPVGATDAAIEAGRYRVTFRGVSGASVQEVEDRALLHAANLALGQGYDWLRVINRTGGYAAPTSPQISFGIGGTSFGRGSAVSVGGSRTVGGEPTYVADLEVVFGKGPKPSLDAYDARSVVDSLGPRLAPPPPR
ncbi:MAG: CC0125/CC1285 family lipoprotein [Caulobacteraceae bacterium]